MNDLIIRHEAKVFLFEYPYAEKVKSKLHSWILEHSKEWDISGSIEEKFGKTRSNNKGVRKTNGWNIFDSKIYSPPNEFKLIVDFVRDVIVNLNKDYHTPVQFNTPPESLKLVSAWGQYYDKGDYQESHNHVPYNWSWTYYVNTPKGSSPMVFDKPSNRKVPAREGMLVLFPAYLWHYVPPNKCDGRSVVVGNFSIIDKI
jgi:hypothetical protein